MSVNGLRVAFFITVSKQLEEVGMADQLSLPKEFFVQWLQMLLEFFLGKLHHVIIEGLRQTWHLIQFSLISLNTVIEAQLYSGILVAGFADNLLSEIQRELFKLFSEEGDDAFFWKTLFQKVLGGYDGLSACVIFANGIAVFNYHFFFPSFLSEL